MVVYYALGGGLGHLVRAWLYLKQTKTTHFKVITANPEGLLLFKPHELIIVPPGAAQNVTGLSRWLHWQLKELAPPVLLLDAFPHGIFGELTPEVTGNIQIIHLSRRLLWRNYKTKLQESSLQFECALILEDLEPEHSAFIQSTSKTTKNYSLDYSLLWQLNPVLHEQLVHQLTWFIVHSGPVEEVEQLCRYALEIAEEENVSPRFWLCTQVSLAEIPSAFVLKTHFPAVHYFQASSRLITAGGFNSMQLHRYFKGDHHFLPFPRKYDDQFWRVRNFKDKWLTEFKN